MWFENGRLQTKGQMKDGLGEGKWCFWDSLAHKTIVGTYHKGKWNGKWTEYDPKGKKLSTGKYDMNKKTGTWSYWDANGDIKKIEVYKKEKLYKEINFEFSQ